MCYAEVDLSSLFLEAACVVTLREAGEIIVAVYQPYGDPAKAGRVTLADGGVELENVGFFLIEDHEAPEWVGKRVELC